MTTLDVKFADAEHARSDWPTRTISDLAITVASGRSSPGRSYGTYPVYGSTGVIGYSEEPEYAGAAVLVARVGANAGKLNLVSGRYGVTDNAIILRLADKAHLPYFWRQLEHKDLNRLVFGSGQPLLTGTQLKQLRVPEPSIDEQKLIAGVLDDVDEYLQQIALLLAKKRDLKQAVMEQLLSGEGRKGASTRSWCSASLGSMGSTYSGLAGKNKTHFGRGAARYIPFMNVMTNTVMDPGWTEPVDVAPQEVQTTVRAGDLLFNGSSETPEEVGYCSVVLTDVPGLYLNSFCFGFRFKQGVLVDGRFFAYWFRSSKGRDAMAVLAQGATRYNIAKSAFLRLPVPVPPLDEQREVADVLSDIDRELAMLVSRRDKAISLKQAMMQQLLTGRIRLI